MTPAPPLPFRRRPGAHVPLRWPAVGRALALGAVLALALGALPRAGRAELRAMGFGEEMQVAGCLRVAVLAVTDRAGDLPHDDWANLRVRNDCPEPRWHLLVELFLLDVNGKVYGARIWVLARGEVLGPGESKTERYPIPDPENLVPRQWALRVLSVYGPPPRRKAPAAPARR